MPMKRMLWILTSLAFLLPSISWAGLCSYKTWKKGSCKCRKGTFKSTVKGTFRLRFMAGKGTVRGKLRKQAKRFCKQVKGRIVGWNDSVKSWSKKKKGSKRYGTMVLRFTCKWEHKKKRKRTRGRYTEVKTKSVSYVQNVGKKSGGFSSKMIQAYKSRFCKQGRTNAPRIWLKHYQKQYKGTTRNIGRINVKYVTAKHRVAKGSKGTILTITCIYKVSGKLSYFEKRTEYRCFRK